MFLLLYQSYYHYKRILRKALYRIILVSYGNAVSPQDYAKNNYTVNCCKVCGYSTIFG
jgi:hypothetical protein